jgi:hypothetical protein
MIPVKRSYLKVGKIISPEGFPTGTIKTEEKCSLESFIDGKKKKRWLCWTVRTKAQRPLHKYLIVDWGKDGIILWEKSTMKFAPQGAKLWVERSGLEEMENITGQGAENYIYSLLVYKLRGGKQRKFYAIERMRNDRVFRYEGTLIG